MDRYTEVLLRLTAKRLNSISEASEIVQDIFLSLWEKRYELYTIENSLYPYLFKAAKYEVINKVLKKEREIIKVRLFFDNSQGMNASSIEDAMIADELKQVLYSAVDKLPTTMRKIFYLSRENNLSIKEIAVSLSLSEQTVKNNLSNTLKHLRLILGKNQESTFLLVAITIHIKSIIT